MKLQANSKEYIKKNPVRSTISALGYGAVESVELVVEVIGTARTANRIVNQQLLNFEKELIEEGKGTMANA